jgi:hypothetical protein
MKALILAGTLLCASAALAAPEPTAAAQRAMAEGEFEKALRLLNREAKRSLPPEALGRVHLLRGQVLSTLRKDEQAREAMRQALVLWPEATLDAETTPPDVMVLLAESRRQVQGELAVAAEGGEAQVYVDGKPFGPAPVRLKLPVGRHEVEVRAGQRVRRGLVVVDARAPQALRFELPPEAPAARAQAVSPAAPDSSAGASPAAGQVRTEGPAVGAGPDRTLPLVATAGGVVLAGVGAYGIVHAWGVQAAYDRQQDPSLPATVSRTDAQRAQAIYPWAVAGAGVGAALLTVGIVGLVSGGEGTAVALVPSTQGASLVAAGSF